MSLFQSNLRKQIRQLPKILKSDSVKILHYHSLLFIRVLSAFPRSTAGGAQGLKEALTILSGEALIQLSTKTVHTTLRGPEAAGCTF